MPPGLAGPLAASRASGTRQRTVVGIDGDGWTINGRPTYEGRTWNGRRIEGLLLNSRMIQGVFDDANPETVGRWTYPDTGRWDPERNTREFLAAMPAWRAHGLLAFTINFQGGSPQGYSKLQPWHNSAFKSNGGLKQPYLDRMERILDFADELGMAVILGVFYFGQDERLADGQAVVRGLDNACNWVLDGGWTNVVIEVNNECDVPRYEHDILKPKHVHELIERVKSHGRDGRRLLVSTSYGGGSLARENVVRSADFILMHGNGVSEPARIAEMVREVRQVAGWRPMPVVFNEDDHFDFDKPASNMLAALSEYASWGYFDPGQSNYRDGYQCPPVNWQINTTRKRAFFGKLKEITGE
ncbi:MAG: hypothetical protein FVQ81_12625 [Candidatus Glassbacteria bacterium]|nr:hypothetical protein [Candidatus Glassbacteria bacterium]